MPSNTTGKKYFFNKICKKCKNVIHIKEYHLMKTLLLFSLQ